MNDTANNARPTRFPALVERFCDGDTCIVTLDLGFDVSIRRRVRLIDLDSWELGSEHDAKARMVADALTTRYHGHAMTLSMVTRHPDRFGRLRGRLFRGQENIAAEIIALGFAWDSLRGPTRRDHDCGLPGNPLRQPIQPETTAVTAPGATP